MSFVQRPHGVFQLASRACPATFANGPNGLQLHAVTPNDTASLSFSVPGTVRILDGLASLVAITFSVEHFVESRAQYRLQKV